MHLAGNASPARTFGVSPKLSFSRVRESETWIRVAPR